jgi:hypothetical protein
MRDIVMRGDMVPWDALSAEPIIKKGEFISTNGVLRLLLRVSKNNHLI